MEMGVSGVINYSSQDLAEEAVRLTGRWMDDATVLRAANAYMTE